MMLCYEEKKTAQAIYHLYQLQFDIFMQQGLFLSSLLLTLVQRLTRWLNNVATLDYVCWAVIS